MNPFSCRQASEHTAGRDGADLHGFALWAYRFHMAYCWFCKKYDRQIRFMGESLRRCTEKKLSEAHTEHLKKKIIDHLRQ